MSDLPPLEQQFSFESSAVRLNDGAIFRPLRDALRCYVMETESGYRISGSTWEALYECKDGRFVLLRFSTPMVRRSLWQPKVREAYDVTGDEVDPQYASRFLIDGQFPIPDELEELFSVEVDESVKQAECRPIANWKSKFPVENSKTPMHETRVIEVLHELRDRGIAAVHELQEWSKLPAGSRDCSELLQFVFRLTRCYRVDPTHWNGPANAIPPKSVSLSDLPWPDGIDEIRNRVLPELLSTLEPVGAILLSNRLSVVEPRANEQEVEAAEQFLFDHLNQIATFIGEIKQAVLDLDTGKVHEALEESDSKGLKPPSDEAFAAYILSTQMEAAEIIERLNLTIHPGTLSRWIKHARKWCQTNSLPPKVVALAESAKRKKPTVKSMDPSRLDLGERQGRPKTDAEDDE